MVCMRSFRLDKNGVIAPAPNHIHVASPIQSLRKPSQALRRLERYKNGDQLRILVSRCLAVGSLLLMANGQLKPIEQIKIGDGVVGPNGKEVRVIEKISNGYRPELISFRTTRMWKPLTCTPNHKILVLDLRGEKHYSLAYYLRRKTNETLKKIRWVNAEDLTKETYPLTPLDYDLFFKTGKIDLSSFTGPRSRFDNDFIYTKGRKGESILKCAAEKFGISYASVADISRGKHKLTKQIHRDVAQYLKSNPIPEKKIVRHLSPTYELGLMFGAFLGDGSARIRPDGGEVSFVLNRDHQEDIEILKHAIVSTLGNDIAVSVSKKKNSKAQVVSFSSVSMAKLLVGFGKRTNKHLPPGYWFDNNDYLRGILDGLQMTDGSASCLVCNTSEAIIHLVYVIAERIGLNPKICREKKPRLSVHRGHTIVGHHSAMYVRQLRSVKNNNENTDKLGSYRISEIISFERVPGAGIETFDISLDTEEHAFVAHNIIVHNTAGGIGDVLMTLPTVKAIKKQYNCVLDYQTDYDYWGGSLPALLENNPNINKIYDYRDLSDSDREDYDAVVELTCPCTAHEQPLAKPIGRIDLFANHAGVVLEDYNIDYFPTQNELDEARDWIVSNHIDRFQLVMVGANSSTSKRDLPLLTLQQSLSGIIQKKPDVRFIIATQSINAGKATWNNHYGCIELRDKTIRQVAAMMTYCQLVMCQDSAHLHLAGALHRKSLSFFGPTDPRARVNTYPEAVAIWPAGNNLRCSPCLPGNASVLTDSGYKNLEDIVPEDRVLTAGGTFNRVSKLHKNPLSSRAIYQLEAVGILDGVACTEDHKLLVADKNKEPQWIQAKDIAAGQYLCIPRTKATATFGDYRDDPEFCWLLGLFTAEGYLKLQTENSRGRSVSFSVGDTEAMALTKEIERIYANLRDKYFPTTHNGGVRTTPNSRGASTIIHISNQKLVEAIQLIYGNDRPRAQNKKVPAFLFSSNAHNIECFLDGLEYGDGYLDTTHKAVVLTTISLELARGVQQLWARLGKLAKIYRRTRDTNFKKNATIYRIYRPLTNTKGKAWYFNESYMFVRIKTVAKTELSPEFVYDISVDDDPTFTASNIAVFDCWYSTAGCNHAQPCWKMFEVSVIMETALAMLQDKPLPSYPQIYHYGPNRKLCESL